MAESRDRHWMPGGKKNRDSVSGSSNVILCVHFPAHLTSCRAPQTALWDFKNKKRWHKMAKQRFSFFLNLRILGSFFFVESQLRKPSPPMALSHARGLWVQKFNRSWDGDSWSFHSRRSQSKTGKLCFVAWCEYVLIWWVGWTLTSLASLMSCSRLLSLKQRKLQPFQQLHWCSTHLRGIFEFLTAVAASTADDTWQPGIISAISSTSVCIYIYMWSTLRNREAVGMWYRVMGASLRHADPSYSCGLFQPIIAALPWQRLTLAQDGTPGSKNWSFSWNHPGQGHTYYYTYHTLLIFVNPKSTILDIWQI